MITGHDVGCDRGTVLRVMMIQSSHDHPEHTGKGQPPGKPSSFVIRGDIYIPRKGFEEMNAARQQKGEAPFANPRNGAAVTLKLLDPKIVATRRSTASSTS
jgi:NAD-dependent DNA ligase